MHWIKNSVLLSLLLFSVQLLPAQSFLNRSKLDSIKQPGFYRIDINPELCQFLKTDFSDLRIATEKEVWVPHIIKRSSPTIWKNILYDFPILKNELIDSGKTEIILKNTSPVKVFVIKLFIKNAAVSRMASISGSNDGQQWYIIDDQVLLHRAYETDKDEYLQELAIPLSSYPFFKLVIDNHQNDPLNVVRAGFYNYLYYHGISQYNQNPLPVLSQKDSGNHSFVTVRWENPTHIERIHVYVKGQKFYNRELRICLPGAKENEPGEVIGHFRLASFTDSIFDIPRIKTAQLLLIIKNDDNPPLQVTKLESEQTKTTALTYIDKPGNYHLLLNNKNVQAPDYDLILFSDSIPPNTEWLSTGPVMANETPVITAKKINRWWIWPAILLAIAALGYISFSLTRDMRKRES